MTARRKKLVSVIVPFFNEAENLPLVYDALGAVLDSAPKYRYEIILVNDGSTDGSARAAEAIRQRDARVRYIEFSRNFGKEMATTAGLHAASGDAALMLDADLQHPPRHIPQMLRAWEGGAEAVIGVRSSNAGEGYVKKWGSRLFYRIMKAISETELERGETDFRLLDRQVIEAYKAFPEHERMTRSLVNWLGFTREKIYFDAPARVNGAAGYSTFKLVHLAFSSFISHSLLPLRLTGYLGVAITLFSGALGVVVFIERYVFKDAWSWNVSGSAQLAVINVFLIGIVLMALGIIALYIANIHTEVANRPLYVIRKRTNF